MPSMRKASSLLSRSRLGIEINSTDVRGVFVKHGHITKTAMVCLAGVESLEAALIQVLETLRGSSVRKPAVYVAIGPAASQLRRLTNLPAIASARPLRELVHSNAGRFFLRNGVPLLTSSVRREESGHGWAAAVEEPPVRAAADACRRAGLRLALVAPSIVAMRRTVDDEWLTAIDGDVVMRAHVGSNGAIRELRRFMAPPVAEPQSLGSAATDFAVPFGATTIDRDEPLVLHERDLRMWRDVSVPGWRMAVAAAALCVAMMLSLTLPALYAQRIAAETARRLEAINRQYREAHWMETELARTTASLSEIDAFQATRRSTIAFMADLTTVLPEDAWLQNLRLDKDGGTLVALAPRAAVTATALASLKSISAPTIVGAVSSEQVGPDRIERVTMRFRWKLPKRNAASWLASGGRGQ